jgi:hypothetical protein
MYFKHQNGFRYVKILNDTTDNAALLEVNLYDFNTCVEFKKMEPYLRDCVPCTAEEFNEAAQRAKEFIDQHLNPNE